MYDRDYMKLQTFFTLCQTFSPRYDARDVTRFYPIFKYLVLPRGNLNNTTWPPHFAVQKYAVITIALYYLLGSK